MTIEAFVTMIWNKQKEEGVQAAWQQLSLTDYGHCRGWLEDRDITDWEAAIERRTAARIIHEFLRKEQNEADEEDWRGAERLKDLYDCHTCVNHVAQVYAKGIMEPAEKESGIFGMRRELTYREAERIVSRMFSKETRKNPEKSDFRQPSAVRLSMEEAFGRLSKEKQAALIDVRMPGEYAEKHLSKAISIPLGEILKNPGGIAEDRGKPLYFYCRQGYQSEIAANCAAEAGYQNVFYFDLLEPVNWI